MVSERTRDYEMVVILSPEANDDEVTASVERLDALITERGGTVADHENWGLRRLAYPINKFQEGNYLLTRFSVDAGAVIELDRSLEASQDILRHLVTRV